MGDKTQQSILWLDQLSNDDVFLVGGKNASLGEMYNTLTSQGIRIPNAFVITAHAYREFVKDTGLAELIKEELADLDTHNIKELLEEARRVSRRYVLIKDHICEGITDHIILKFMD